MPFSIASFAQRQPWLFLLLLPAWLYLGFVLPIVDVLLNQGTHLNLFSYLMLVILPVFLGTGVLAVTLHAMKLAPKSLDLWQMLAIAPLMTLIQWATLMAFVTISLFVLPAWLNEGITGAFYYYMVPLQGIWVGALIMNMLSLGSLYRQYGCPYSHGTLWSKRCKSLVLGLFPLIALIYFVFHYVFFEMIF